MHLSSARAWVGARPPRAPHRVQAWRRRRGPWAPCPPRHIFLVSHLSLLSGASQGALGVKEISSLEELDFGVLAVPVSLEPVLEAPLPAPHGSPPHSPPSLLCPVPLVSWPFPQYAACGCALSLIRLCEPMDCSLPGSSVHRISQARILEWVAISSSRGFDPGIKPTPLGLPALASGFSTSGATRKES